MNQPEVVTVETFLFRIKSQLDNAFTQISNNMIGLRNENIQLGERIKELEKKVVPHAKKDKK